MRFFSEMGFIANFRHREFSLLLTQKPWEKHQLSESSQGKAVLCWCCEPYSH